MAQQINIPGVGIVEFPESMSDEQITQAIKTEIYPRYGKEKTTTSESIGKNVASLADLAIEGVGGALGVPAYAAGYLANEGMKTMNFIGEALGAAPQQLPTSSERAQSWKEAVAKPFTSVIGDLSGVTQTPTYRQMPIRQGVENIGRWAEENVVQPVAGTMGVPESDVQQLLDTALLVGGPKIAKGAADVTAKTARGAADVARQIPEGVSNAFKSPDAPVASRPITQETIDIMRAQGTLSPTQEAMVQMAGRQVPIKGRVPEAVAENITRGYRELNTLPGALQGAADIAGLLGVGIPFQGSLVKGAVPLATAFNPLRSVDNFVNPLSPETPSSAFTTRSGQGVVQPTKTRTVDELNAALGNINKQDLPKPVVETPATAAAPSKPVLPNTPQELVNMILSKTDNVNEAASIAVSTRAKQIQKQEKEINGLVVPNKVALERAQNEIMPIIESIKESKNKSENESISTFDSNKFNNSLERRIQAMKAKTPEPVAPAPPTSTQPMSVSQPVKQTPKPLSPEKQSVIDQIRSRSNQPVVNKQPAQPIIQLEPVQQTAAPTAPSRPVEVPNDKQKILDEIRARAAAKQLGVPETLLPPSAMLESKIPETSSTTPVTAKVAVPSTTDKLSSMKKQLEKDDSKELFTWTDQQKNKSEIDKFEKDPAFAKETVKKLFNEGGMELIRQVYPDIPIDIGKDAYNGSNFTKGQASFLIKNQIDFIPDIPNLTEAQVINLIYDLVKSEYSKR